MKYDHRKIEQKWQQFWRNNKTFKCAVDHSKPKYYVLDMFPYPSGAGLHVGHVVGYTATDILARYKRQCGFNVLHPMGWDSFGLPAEQYAIRTRTHPAITTKANIDNFRSQLQSLGFSYDWDREFATSDPKYYKWTQWIFTKLFERGLAYEAEMEVNFCPALGTVLANEEVDNGVSVEGGHPVERRPLRQWVLKITAYADRLLNDLDLVDWPEHLKRQQRNWIGRSEGAVTCFKEKETSEEIKIFTTCPHTLFGATYMVLAPEHPLVKRITTEEQEEVVEAYRKEARHKSDLDRTDLAKEKTGVFTGAYAINPVNGEEIPIWISDYVLMSYGTGAIMAVPAHDERDFEFATKFNLPIRCVVDPGEDHEERADVIAGKKCCIEGGTMVNSPGFDGLSHKEAMRKVTQWLEENDFGKFEVHYKLRDWLFSRQRYWGEPFPILHLEDGTKRVLGIDELPLCPPEVTDYTPNADGQSPLSKVTEWVEVTDPKTGKKALRETNTMPQWAGSCWYYLRFVDPHNESIAWNRDAEKYWLPVDMYVGGVEHAVLHLLYSRFWHKVLHDCGLVSTSEPFQTLRNQGLVVSRSFKDKSNAYVDWAEVEKNEGQYFHHETKEELTSQIEKMSKSKLNGVNPDEIIDEFGADALRLYEMFMGPLEKEKVWNTDAVSGCYRFLSRFYDLAVSPKVSDEMSPEALRLGHRLVAGVTRDTSEMQFNTAIAKMMEFINHFSKLDTYPKQVLAWAAQCLSPYAPHLAEEVWELLGCEAGLSHAPYPDVDEAMLVDATQTYVVQVNGKLRGRFDLPKDQNQDVILAAARETPQVSKYLVDKEILKVIFVPNKLLNIVVK